LRLGGWLNRKNLPEPSKKPDSILSFNHSYGTIMPVNFPRVSSGRLGDSGVGHKSSKSSIPMSEKESFETSLEALEKIVQRLEGGGVSLEESIKLFEQGRRHAQVCSTKLNEVERRIQVLLQDEQGRTVLRDLPEEEALDARPSETEE